MRRKPEQPNQSFLSTLLSLLITQDHSRHRHLRGKTRPLRYFPTSVNRIPDSPPPPAAVMGAGKRNTEIKKIENKSARYVCFSKRREGLFKKAQQYHKISGSLIAVLVFSPTGRSYVHGSPSFDPIIDQFLHSSTAASMTSMTAAGTSSTGWSCMTEPSVSDSASTTNNVGLREQVEAIKLEGCDSLEELLEMKRKLEEVRETVLCSLADSLIS